MTEGINEYYLCGDISLMSVIRDEVLTHMKFEVPPEYLRNKMAELAEVMKAKDPYDVSVMTDSNDNVFNYRVEVTHAFTKEQLFELEELGFNFESIGPRGESIVLWLKDRKI